MIDRRQAYDSATLGLSQAKANRGLGGSLVGARRVMPFLGLDAHGVTPNRQLEGCVSKNKTAISLSHSLSFQSRASTDPQARGEIDKKALSHPMQLGRRFFGGPHETVFMQPTSLDCRRSLS